MGKRRRRSEASDTDGESGSSLPVYFEVLSGLRNGDAVITGPFESVRQLSDGEQVRVTNDATRNGSGVSFSVSF